MTILQFEKQFPNEEAARDYLIRMRWPNGVRCVRCGSEKVHKITKRWAFQCKQCNKAGYKFSPLVGTIFENTNVPLKTWFHVVLLMTQSKKGISALQVHRMIGSGSYRTAWYMCHRIRAAMKSADFTKLTGTVEVDETYIGGEMKNMHRAKAKKIRETKILWGKIAVVGAAQRGGPVVTQIIERVNTAELIGFVRKIVDERVDLVATDEKLAYRTLGYMGYKHGAVSHVKGEYVRGQIHTANLDSFWSLLKRGVMGTFHQVSKKYLPLYLNEFSYRHNERKNPDMFAAVIAQA